jgi:riboflavin synthase
MFTGIIEELGIIKNIERGSQSIKLSISCMEIMKDIHLGDSIAVNGICLTANFIGRGFFTADVMPETMRKTNLGELDLSQKVNLERALKLSDRLGGHFVSGHIDGTGILAAKVGEDNATWFTIKATESIMKYIILKGSVCLDGTSLTVAYADEECFKVSLIPHTSDITTLGEMAIGDKINIECDIIAKYIEKLVCSKAYIGNNKKGLSLDFLKENGFT